MCSNYKPVTLQDRLLAHFGVERPDDVAPPDLTWPGYFAPFIVRHADKVELRELLVGRYGLLPEWSKDLAFGRKTYNCRSETAAEKPSFREAWKKGRRCIIPVEELYEQCYETGKAVRWAIRRIDGPMGVAGLWGVWLDPKSGERVPTFTMLTVNADGHAIFGRMHAPGEEKRMPVILEREDFDPWLNCAPEAAAGYMRQCPAERLHAEPAPLPPRPKKQKPLPLPKSPDLDDDEPLF